MRIASLQRDFVLFALLTVLAALRLPAAADDATGAEAGRVFLPSGDPMFDVDETLARALAGDKLALIVMGANWCHDSRALAARLQRPEMRSIVDENYEIEFVDVGNLDAGMDVIRRFGQPVIYGTPTVLIVDPATERVINFDTSPQWRNASIFSMDETVEYFSGMARPDLREMTDEDVSPQLASVLSAIDAWELAQSERLYDAYAVLAPMLQQYQDGNPPVEFDGYWDQVAAMRARITEDLATLRTQARARAAADEGDIALNYPDYPPFAWEPAQ